MSSAILNLIAKKALKDTAKKNINSKDPYFEDVKVYGRDGRPTGQVKKQKKGVPPGISQQDGQVLKKVRRRAYRLDMSLASVFGVKFGWSAIIGLVPVIGDFLDMLLAWNVVRTCGQIEGGLPPALKSRMYFNIALDFGLGLVPLLGDLVDAVFRANTRNAWILEEYLIKKAEAETQVQAGHAAGAVNGGDGLPARPGPVHSISNTLRNALRSNGTQRHDEEMAMGTVNTNGQAQQQRRS